MVTDLAGIVRGKIRSIPDFPRKGIMFRDITPLLNDPGPFMQVVDYYSDRYRDRGITRVVSIESRGFILGSVLAYHLGAGFVPVRKPGKLPYSTIQESYTLEYGQDTLEMHVDAIGKGDVVLIVDDLLATGGTANATAKLVERSGASVYELSFLIELSFLGGRRKLGSRPVFALVDFQNEL
jgi:adenine phosphoribosyltransferase